MIAKVVTEVVTTKEDHIIKHNKSAHTHLHFFLSTLFVCLFVAKLISEAKSGPNEMQHRLNCPLTQRY